MGSNKTSSARQEYALSSVVHNLNSSEMVVERCLHSSSWQGGVGPAKQGGCHYTQKVGVVRVVDYVKCVDIDLEVLGIPVAIQWAPHAKELCDPKVQLQQSRAISSVAGDASGPIVGRASVIVGVSGGDVGGNAGMNSEHRSLENC